MEIAGAIVLALWLSMLFGDKITSIDKSPKSIAESLKKQ